MSTGLGNFKNILSNIIHKTAVRVSPVSAIAHGLQEHNRYRSEINLTANGSASTIFVAPWKGAVESLIVSSPAATTSTSSNHVTITLTDLTTGTTLLSFDSYTNLQELALNTGTPIVASGAPAVSPATGVPVSEFNQFDVLQLTATVFSTGTLGITSSSVLPITWTVFPTDSLYAV